MQKHNHLYMLQRDCGEIGSGSTYNCDTPLQGGADPNVTLINHKDLISVTYGSTPNLITGITLANGKSGFKYEGFGRSVSPQQEAVKAAGSGQTLAKHQVGIFIFSRTQLTKNEIQKMFIGKFIAIVKATSKDENAFEMFGLGLGLELVPGVIQQLNENNGAYNIILATPENQQEAKLPQTIYDGTSFATTNTLVENLWYEPAVYNLSDIALPTAGGDAVIVVGKNFYGSGIVSDVTSVKWVNQSSLVETTQTSVTVSSATTLNFSSVALTAGTYKLKVITSKGSAYSPVNVVVS